MRGGIWMLVPRAPYSNPASGRKDLMKTRTMLLLATVCVFAVACFAAEDANVGSWKLNEAKSKIPAGASKNNSVVYTAEGDSYKCVVEAVDSSGQPLHNEW